MHIDQVIIEGFKSYATRTVIGKWDPRFNAITGLNGTGKSNILDSICFVLGITNLSHVRATNLQDLVYKKGQAGINKASVTIIFDNQVTDRSPPGYEDDKTISITRQVLLKIYSKVIIGGKNKYLINGRNANQQDVTNMFQSVQLNIQNPNFLIMQGKITQVLNMKPAQILGMIEEAAGTRLYEDRKEKALKAIEKKESKLAQSAMLLDTEITPKLDELREKKRILLDYQKIKSEREHLEKLVVSHDYQLYQNKIEKFDERKQNIADRIVHLEKTQEILNIEVQDAQERISQVAEEKAKNGGAYFELEGNCTEIGKDIAKVTTQLSLIEKSINEENENMEALKKSLEEAKSGSQSANEKRIDLETTCEAKLNEYQKIQESLKDTENLVQTLTTGLASSEGQENGYMDQLKTAKLEESNSSSEIKQQKIKLAHLQKEIKSEEPKVVAARKENSSILAELDRAKKVLEMITDELNSTKINFDDEGDLLDKKNELLAKRDSLLHNIESLERSMNGLSFKYSDPHPNFDRSKVKGLVATLIDIPENHLDKATALEICAGGKLYQVVVENEQVATQLLKNGKLQKRVTIIPLNQIKAFKVQAERIANAKRLSPGNVDLALSLVGSDKELTEAMNFVFGSTLVCKDSAVAKLVTFDKNVNLRSVTLDGDSYDPSGQLTGGSKSQSSGLLLKVQSLRKMQAELKIVESHLQKATNDLEDFQTRKQLYNSLVQKKELKLHELELLQKRMANNPHYKIIQNFEVLVEQHKATKEGIESSKEKQNAAILKIKSIEKEMSELNDNRETKMKSLNDKVKSFRKQLGQLGPSVEKMQQSINLAKEEHVQLESEISRILESIDSLEQAIEDLNLKSKDYKAQIKGLQASLKTNQIALEREKKSLVAFDKEMNQIEKSMNQKKRQLEESQLELQQSNIDFKNLSSELKNAQEQMKNLEKKFTWIKDQKELFGKEGGPFDTSKINVSESSKRIKVLESEENKLSRSVDRSAVEKFDRVEKNEISLKQKLSRVQKDKSSIHSTLEYLDRKKLTQLEKTWIQVNEDFGAIFGDLLPGNTCKLEPPEDCNITEGLEVKVCLGGVWKQSLTELSGGQRSLIALSLILALLKYNPAPMYILDEVDAALDLSHTQNIGKLLKTRFKTSQFILVSLKDGMYNNANVLFRTKFVDGVSQVERKEQVKLKQ